MKNPATVTLAPAQVLGGIFASWALASRQAFAQPHCFTEPIDMQQPPADRASELLRQLQADAHNLSPALRRVAHFCIAHAHQLHQMRIQEVAQACQTIPAAVVRLAQRYGLTGFRELKLAFLPVFRPPPLAPDMAPPASAEPQRQVISQMAHLAEALFQAQADVLHPDFAQTTDAIRDAASIKLVRPLPEQMPVFDYLKQGFARCDVAVQVVDQMLPLPNELWLLFPSSHAPDLKYRKRLGNWIQRPDELQCLRSQAAASSVRYELLGSFASGNAVQHPLRAIAFCDALCKALSEP
ncbi:MAG: hypothetical protein RL323_879 [Pseudomonadota bacterium]